MSKEIGLVEIKCNNCPGKLRIDWKTNYAECESCASQYLIKRESASSGSKTIAIPTPVTPPRSDDPLDAADWYMKQKKFDVALKKYEQESENRPQIYRCWWGIIRAASQEFTADLFYDGDLKLLKEYFNYAMTSVPQDRKAGLQRIFSEYYSAQEKKNLVAKNALTKKREQLQQENEKRRSEISRLEKTEYSGPMLGFFIFLAIVGGALIYFNILPVDFALHYGLTARSFGLIVGVGLPILLLIIQGIGRSSADSKNRARVNRIQLLKQEIENSEAELANIAALLPKLEKKVDKLELVTGMRFVFN